MSYFPSITAFSELLDAGLARSYVLETLSERPGDFCLLAAVEFDPRHPLQRAWAQQEIGRELALRSCN
ncbi:hypothetical protein V3589_11375 [Sinorhizobium fredii]|uniref:hypothetical protein n=1 Tax=Rhizobium fredii TaxID=380 RepID=UPI0030B3EC56